MIWYWLKPDGHTHEKRMKKLKSEVSSALITLLDEVDEFRPRVLIGLGQGAVVVAMTSFPVIMERECRDRAVTQQQMLTFRQAWSGVAALLIVDPVILPTSNNVRALPFEMLKEAFPSRAWDQSKGQRRAILYSSSYLTPRFATDLSEYVGCPAEKGIYPEGLLDEAKRPPPLYFETDDPTLQGVCCLCYKKGVLGRCPNSGCGLLMHYTCVQSENPAAPQICPICKTENDSEEKIPKSMPFWQEAEIGLSLIHI